MVVLPELETGNEESGQAVVAALLDLKVEDGESAHAEVVGARRLEPRQHLPLGDGEPGQLRDELRGPGAGADYEPTRLITSAGGTHPHAARLCTPLQHGFATVDLSAVRLCLHHMRDVAPLRQQEPTLGLVQAL